MSISSPSLSSSFPTANSGTSWTWTSSCSAAAIAANRSGPYCRLLEYAPGEVIVEEDTWESSIFYILVSGKLEASVTEPDGKRVKVGEVPAGNSFGEMALLSGTPRTATVSVAADSGPRTCSN